MFHLLTSGGIEPTKESVPPNPLRRRKLGISTVIALISSIPKLFQVIKLIKPIKEKVLEVEEKFNNNVKAPGELLTKELLNGKKHDEVATYLKLHLLPRIRKYDFDEYDIDTMIRFVVLFIRKVKKLRRFKG